MKDQPFTHERDVGWTLGAGARRKVMSYGDGLMLVRVEFEAGAVGEPHSHPHLQCASVESGVFDVTIDGRTERLSRGDTFFVPSGAVHGAVCIEPGVLIDVFAPMREDFV